MPEALQSNELNEVARSMIPMLYRVASNLVGNRTLAEELVATTLLNATKGWDRFDGSHPTAWFLKILNNAAARVRSVEARNNHELIDAETVSNTPDFTYTIALQDGLRQALSLLPYEQCVVVTLCDAEGLTYEEVAEILEVPKGTVCSRLFRARKSLEASCRHLLENP